MTEKKKYKALITYTVTDEYVFDVMPGWENQTEERIDAFAQNGVDDLKENFFNVVGYKVDIKEVK